MTELGPCNTACFSRTLVPSSAPLDVPALRGRSTVLPPKPRGLDPFEYFPVPGDPISNVIREIPREEYQRCNADLEKHLSFCEQYNRDIERWSDLMDGTIIISFGLDNPGTISAEDVVVALSFPVGMRVVTEEEFLQ
jgi:hypothetical protein